MATGERICFFRSLQGMTQKYLSLIPVFPENSADVRLAQCELGDRTPKADLTAQMAEALDVSPRAIAVPDIDHMDGLMHTRLRAWQEQNARYRAGEITKEEYDR